MKKYRLFAFFAVLLLMLSSYSVMILADDIDRSCIFDNEEYQKEILNAADADELLIYEELILSDQDAGNAYMVHIVRSEDLRDTLLDGKSVFEIISKAYSWICPKDQKELIFINDNGAWRCSGVVEPGMYSDIIDNALVSQKIGEITEKEGRLIHPVVYFGAGRYMTYFAYFETKEAAHFIPFGARPDFTGLENGRVYGGEEMIRILEEKYPLPDITDVDPSVMGGYAYSPEPEIQDYLYRYVKDAGVVWPYITAAAAVFIAICFFTVRKIETFREKK